MDGMDHLYRKVNEMKLSLDIIDGYNNNTKDYCDSLSERVKNANEKLIDLKDLFKKYENGIQDQEELIKTLEIRKEKLMSLLKQYPKGCVLAGAGTYEIQEQLNSQQITTQEKTSNDNNKMKETVKPIFEQATVNNTFLEDNQNSMNATFIKKNLCLTPKPRYDLELSLSFVTNNEFSQIPSYMRGRITMDIINDFINIFNLTLNKKYELIKKARKNKSKQDMEQCLLWKEQETGELKGLYFCTGDDFDKLGGIKIGNKKYQNIITMLRHLKKMREVRNMKMIYYVATF